MANASDTQDIDDDFFGDQTNTIKTDDTTLKTDYSVTMVDEDDDPFSKLTAIYEKHGETEEQKMAKKEQETIEMMSPDEKKDYFEQLKISKMSEKEYMIYIKEKTAHQDQLEKDRKKAEKKARQKARKKAKSVSLSADDIFTADLDTSKELMKNFDYADDEFF